VALRQTFLPRLRALAGRSTHERGYTLIELMIAMAILAFVLAGLTTLFVSGANAELDMNRRFQAEQHAALALKKLRREIHCAKEASTTGGVLTVELESYCRGGPATIVWCTASLGSGRFGLFRSTDATCDASDVRWADFLTQASIFSFEHPDGSLQKIAIVLPVDLDPTRSPAPYRIEDAIVLRNSERAEATP
jgi:prepilin-type N-terminal cleavage/methylation domain-containing protein